MNIIRSCRHAGFTTECTGQQKGLFGIQYIAIETMINDVTKNAALSNMDQTALTRNNA